jgi:hypothetical protein
MKQEQIKFTVWMKKQEIEDVEHYKKGVYGFCTYEPKSDDGWHKVRITIEEVEEL